MILAMYVVVKKKVGSVTGEKRNGIFIIFSDFSRKIFILLSSSKNNKVEEMYNGMGFVDDEIND